MSALTDYVKDCMDWKYIYHKSFDIPDGDELAVEAQLRTWFRSCAIRDAWNKQEESLDGVMVDALVFGRGDELAEAQEQARKAIEEGFLWDCANEYAAWKYLERKSASDAADHRAEAA